MQRVTELIKMLKVSLAAIAMVIGFNSIGHAAEKTVS
jgi:hypothetical protein